MKKKYYICSVIKNKQEERRSSIITARRSMRKQNSYVIYDERNDYNGQSYIEYMAYAYSEDQVREMATEKGIDLTGYTIELNKTNIHDEMGRQYPCKIFSAVVE